MQHCVDGLVREGNLKKIPLVVIALVTQLWPVSASAASDCELQQWDPERLTRCIDELRKQIDRDRVEIEGLKKQLCMVAIEQHRRNSQSEALKLVIEEACPQFKKPVAPGKRS